MHKEIWGWSCQSETSEGDEPAYIPAILGDVPRMEPFPIGRVCRDGRWQMADLNFLVPL